MAVGEIAIGAAKVVAGEVIVGINVIIVQGHITMDGMRTYMSGEEKKVLVKNVWASQSLTAVAAAKNIDLGFAQHTLHALMEFQIHWNLTHFTFQWLAQLYCFCSKCKAVNAADKYFVHFIVTESSTTSASSLERKLYSLIFYSLLTVPGFVLRCQQFWTSSYQYQSFVFC